VLLTQLLAQCVVLSVKPRLLLFTPLHSLPAAAASAEDDDDDGDEGLWYLT